MNGPKPRYEWYMHAHQVIVVTDNASPTAYSCSAYHIDYGIALFGNPYTVYTQRNDKVVFVKLQGTAVRPNMIYT